VPFAGIFFLWFLGVMRAHVGDAEDKFLATVFLGSGLIFVATMFGAAAAAAAVLATGPRRRGSRRDGRGGGDGPAAELHPARPSRARPAAPDGQPPLRPAAQFRPDRLHARELAEIVTGLVDGFGDSRQIDVVDQFAYPFPVTVICRLLGVPREDEPRSRAWVDPIVAGLDPDTGDDGDERGRAAQEARLQLGMYLAGLVEQRSKNPGEDMLSQLVRGHGPDGPMTTMEVLTTSVLLLIAGHETTVNLITNGMLTLLRHPEFLRKLREDPGQAVDIVEELLRYEPPVQLVPQRTCIADIEVRGVTIPKGSRIWLFLAAGNRDPERFHDPGRFDPYRGDIQHLGFGSGIHACFGAPLARLEAQIALSELARRLDNPRLAKDPPPYRQNAVLRGPRHLNVIFAGLQS
jgi:cytochrome P450